MTVNTLDLPDTNISCNNCEASCCRLEVILMTDAGIPQQYIETDNWGGMRMIRLEDGWCAALDRNTMRCTIYVRRPDICRELEMGGYECVSIRAATR